MTTLILIIFHEASLTLTSITEVSNFYRFEILVSFKQVVLPAGQDAQSVVIRGRSYFVIFTTFVRSSNLKLVMSCL